MSWFWPSSPTIDINNPKYSNKTLINYTHTNGNPIIGDTLPVRIIPQGLLEYIRDRTKSEMKTLKNDDDYRSDNSDFINVVDAQKSALNEWEQKYGVIQKGGRRHKTYKRRKGKKSKKSLKRKGRKSVRK